MTDTKSRFRIAVGIATKGRAQVLAETLDELRRQTRRPDHIVICHTTPDDVAGIEATPGLETLTGPTGLTHQRNAILKRMGDYDAVLFLDDDFFPTSNYIEATIAAFEMDPAIVITTGAVIADGANGPGFTPEAARVMLTTDMYAGPFPGAQPAWNGYGCNMAVRLAPVRKNDLWFDERLPLYAWYEDIDFSRRLAAHGSVATVMAARGVHLGVKSGRTSGRRLGYSQVINPIYLALKGSFRWRDVAISVGRNMAANVTRSCWCERHVDRRGRLVGNITGIADLLRGNIRPERILEM